MKFTEFEVLRIGNEVVLSCYTDEPGKGMKVQVQLCSATREEAEMYEQLFKRLAQCATVYEEVPDDVLQATLTLMKGQSQ